MKFQLTEKIISDLKAQDENQALAFICVAAKLLGPRFDEAKKILKERLETTGEIITPEGIRLFIEQKEGPREIPVGPGRQEAWHRLAGKIVQNETTGALEFSAGALDEIEALECVKISVADTEKALAAKHGLPLSSKKGDSGKARTETLFGDLIERKPTTWLQIVG